MNSVKEQTDFSTENIYNRETELQNKIELGEKMPQKATSLANKFRKSVKKFTAKPRLTHSFTSEQKDE